MTMNTILLAVGGNDDARIDDLVRTAIQETPDTDGEVVLLHVFDPEQYRSLIEQLNLPATASPDRLAARTVPVKRVSDRLDAEGITIHVTGRVGDRSDAILETAETVDADRVIVGGRKRSPVGKAIRGSTAQTVMLNAPCPTTFVRA